MTQRTKRTLLAVCICVGLAALLTYASTGHSQDGEDLLQLVKAGSHDASDAIRSGRGTINVQAWQIAKDGAVSRSEVVYNVVFVGDRYKMSVTENVLENTPDSSTDKKRLMVPPGTVIRRELSFDGNTFTDYYPDRKSASIQSKDKEGVVLWRTIGPRGCGIYQAPTLNGHAVREKVNGVDCIIVNIDDNPAPPGPNNFTIKTRRYLDPAKGYTVTRLLIYGRDNDHKEDMLLDEENAEVRNYGGGLWGPGKYTSESYRPSSAGDIRKARSIIITYDPDFQLNVPVSDSELKLVLPSGTGVHDELSDAVYTVP